MSRAIVMIVAALLLAGQDPAAAQENGARFQIGGQFAGASSGEFDNTDAGLGARFSWHATPLLAAEAEVTFYPDDLPDGPAPFSRSRIEGLFGVTAGPAIGRLRPFAKLRPGFVTFEEAPGPIPCIAIFPPPLSCTLASGRTLFALDLGGGLEMYPTARTVVRVDAGDRMVRYPGTVLDSDFTPRDDAFFGHDFRFSVGAGWRF